MKHASAHYSTCGLRRLMSADITAAAEAPAIVISPGALLALRPSIYFVPLQKFFLRLSRGAGPPQPFLQGPSPSYMSFSKQTEYKHREKGNICEFLEKEISISSLIEIQNTKRKLGKPVTLRKPGMRAR